MLPPISFTAHAYDHAVSPRGSHSALEESRGCEPDWSDPHLSMLYLGSANRAAERGTARQDIHNASIQLRNLREEARKAHEEARANEEDSSFWTSIAGTAGTVGTIAAAAATVACTGGIGAVVVAAGAATKLGAMTAKEAGIIDEKAAFWLETGGALAMTAGTLAPAEAPATALAAAVSGGGQAVSLGAGIVQAGAIFESKQYAASAQESLANVESRKAEATLTEAERDAAMTSYRKSAKAQSKEMGIAADITEAQHQATIAIIANFRG